MFFPELIIQKRPKHCGDICHFLAENSKESFCISPTNSPVTEKAPSQKEAAPDCIWPVLFPLFLHFSVQAKQIIQCDDRLEDFRP
jgi:hypothetical protein